MWLLAVNDSSYPPEFRAWPPSVKVTCILLAQSMTQSWPWMFLAWRIADSEDINGLVEKSTRNNSGYPPTKTSVDLHWIGCWVAFKENTGKMRSFLLAQSSPMTRACWFMNHALSWFTDILDRFLCCLLSNECRCFLLAFSPKILEVSR